ncbi:MAG TPA: LLM class flavin-dependent oxidoreductase, partial [Actinomycetota bacterium]|nr:LLM class flavin-dependent oxidoreductase [Actinomycetota bacterium]
LERWLYYFTRVAALPLLPPEMADIKIDDLIDLMNMSGLSVIGTPDMAIEAIRRLEKQSGGFGTYLFMSHEWADREQTLRSYELFSRYVIPEINGTTASLTGSRDWVAEHHPKMRGQVMSAIEDATKKYVEERDAGKK